MSLITSAMIFSSISFTRFEYPTSRATSHRLLISRGVPRVKSKIELDRLRREDLGRPAGHPQPWPM